MYLVTQHPTLTLQKIHLYVQNIINYIPINDAFLFYLGNVQYWMENEPATWLDAWITCSSKQRALAVVDSQPVYDKIIDETYVTHP